MVFSGAATAAIKSALTAENKDYTNHILAPVQIASRVNVQSGGSFKSKAAQWEERKKAGQPCRFQFKSRRDTPIH